MVVAGFASWHEGHEAATAALSRRPRLPAHAALESFSVLTRLPPPHRVSAELVRDFLAARFSAPCLGLPDEGYSALIGECTAAGLRGGSVYDALIGVTARQCGATLLSRDGRAAQVYQALGVDFELLV